MQVLAAHAHHSLLASGAAWRMLSLEDDAVAAVAAAVRHPEATRTSVSLVGIGGSSSGAGAPGRGGGGGLAGVAVAFAALVEQRALEEPGILRVFPALCSALGALPGVATCTAWPRDHLNYTARTRPDHHGFRLHTSDIPIKELKSITRSTSAESKH